MVPASIRLWSGFSRETRRLARFFRCWPADLLHSQQTGCEEAPVAARLAGIPRVVGTFHVDPMYDLENQRSGFRHRILEVISNRALHKGIAISDAVNRMWRERTFLSASRVVTIHNGIDPEKFCRRRSREEARRMLGLPDDGRLLMGGVGRLDDAKGFRYLIEALQLLEASHPGASVVLAGRGIRREELEQQAERAGLRERVIFLGHCPEIQVLYDAVDLLAAPSLCESLSYAIQEAMAHELPVVGSRVGGIPELIVPGETGFLVAPRSGSDLAAALAPLLESGDLRCQMGRAGRERIVRHFTEKEMVGRTLDLYRQLLGPRFTPVKCAAKISGRS
jgi:glycosyltransferase involved in cell wall biosynthesis